MWSPVVEFQRYSTLIECEMNASTRIKRQIFQGFDTCLATIFNDSVTSDEVRIHLAIANNEKLNTALSIGAFVKTDVRSRRPGGSAIEFEDTRRRGDPSCGTNRAKCS